MIGKILQTTAKARLQCKVIKFSIIYFSCVCIILVRYYDVASTIISFYFLSLLLDEGWQVALQFY